MEVTMNIRQQKYCQFANLLETLATLICQAKMANKRRNFQNYVIYQVAVCPILVYVRIYVFSKPKCTELALVTSDF